MSDVDTFRFRCLHCTKPLQVKKSLAGKQIKCPGCEQRIVVPHPEMKAPGDAPFQMLPAEEEPAPLPKPVPKQKPRRKPQRKRQPAPEPEPEEEVLSRSLRGRLGCRYATNTHHSTSGTMTEHKYVTRPVYLDQLESMGKEQVIRCETCGNDVTVLVRGVQDVWQYSYLLPLGGVGIAGLVVAGLIYFGSRAEDGVGHYVFAGIIAFYALFSLGNTFSKSYATKAVKFKKREAKQHAMFRP